MPKPDPAPATFPVPPDGGLIRWLRHFGRYYAPSREHCHRLLAGFFVGMGFDLLSVERLESHPVWVVRARFTEDAQLFLLLSVADAHVRAPDILGRHLRMAIRRFLLHHGERVLAKDVVVVRRGIRVDTLFEWYRGSPGVWKPERSKVDPWRVSLVLRRWLQTQVN